MGKREAKQSKIDFYFDLEFYRTENKYDPYLIKDALQQFITDELKNTYKVKENFKF